LKLNPHISVDCVVIGFDEDKLKVLLTERRFKTNGTLRKEESDADLKLPGDFITDDEDLTRSAYRVLRDITGLSDIYLQQFGVFGDPKRISRERDIAWLRETTGMNIERVITITYYSLIKINESRRELAQQHDALWLDIDQVEELAFDHKKILDAGLETLRRKLQFEPVGIELLPEKFTIRQLQLIYETILGKKMDKRNFRKKVLKVNYLIKLNEKEKNVAHKPANLYRFDKRVYKSDFNEFEGFQF